MQVLRQCLVRLAHESGDALMPATRNERLDACQHRLPVAHQVELHYRNQHGGCEGAHQAQPANAQRSEQPHTQAIAPLQGCCYCITYAGRIEADDHPGVLLKPGRQGSVGAIQECRKLAYQLRYFLNEQWQHRERKQGQR